MSSASHARSNDGVARYPTLRAYEQQLPDGWASYPDCRARAVLLRGLARAGVLRDFELLPPDLIAHAGLLERAQWLPEVIHTAVLLAVRDVRFTGVAGEDDFIEWMAQLNAEITPDGSVGNPRDAGARIAALWNDLHGGMPAWVLEAEPERFALFVTHPPELVAPIVQRWRRRAVAEFLVGMGATSPEVRDTPTEMGTRIDARWR